MKYLILLLFPLLSIGQDINPVTDDYQVITSDSLEWTFTPTKMVLVLPNGQKVEYKLAQPIRVLTFGPETSYGYKSSLGLFIVAQDRKTKRLKTIYFTEYGKTYDIVDSKILKN